MIAFLMQSIPSVGKPCLEVRISGESLTQEIYVCILNLKETGFKVCSVISYNSSANANAFFH